MTERSAELRTLPNHPDDGHKHYFACVRCGVDNGVNEAAVQASTAPPDEGLLPAPPFPEEGCDCSACRVLRRHQAEMYAQRRALAADTDKP